ncbi:glycosyltransferase [Anaerolineales bacterium]
MNICLISRCPPYPLYLGDRLIIWHLAKQLSQRGHTIDLIAFGNRPQDWEEQPHYQAFFRSIQLYHEPQRSLASYLQRLIKVKKRFPTQAQEAWSKQMWQGIEHSLEDHHYDVIHLFGGVQVYEFAHLIQDRPSIISPYESFSLYLKRENQHKRSPVNHLKQWIASQYESFMYNPFDKTVVLAQPDYDELKSIQAALKLEIIPNGIDLDYFQAKDQKREKNSLLFVGNFEYEPNQDAARQLIDKIFPQVQAQIPDAKLYLVGNGPPDWLKQSGQENEQIIVTGRVPDVRDYLAQCSVFVSPLRIGAGIKNKILEALAMNIPMIASQISVDGIPVENDRDVLIRENSAMPEAIIQVLQDETYAERLSHGRHFIEENFTWKQVADRYEALYESVLRP